MKQYLSLFLKGLAMGAANVIPGVSGGTIAFITGIYQRLIDALKAFDLNALKLLLSGDFKVFANKTDLYFLIAIFAGIAVSILSLARVLSYCLEFYEVYTMAFFFGLIIASIFGVGRDISAFNASNILFLLLGVCIAGSIAILPPAEASASFIYLTLCGVVAICSMILPGLSGSYILFLMGNYLLVMEAVGNLNFAVLAPVMLGCLVGFILFSRLLSYLFGNFRDQTVSILTGFVAGSLVIIWPWKITEYMILENGKKKPVGYDWFFPAIDTSFFIAFGLVVIGFVIVWGIERAASRT